MEETKKCKYCKTDIPKDAKVCPNCKKKQGMKKWPIILIVVIILIIGIASMGGDDDSSSAKKTGTTNDTTSSETTETSDDSEDSSSDGEISNVFYVGDIVETDEVKISYISSGEVESENEFIEPDKGNVFYQFEFEFENIGDSDYAISSLMSFNCYADSYQAEQAFFDTDIDGTISPGKKLKGTMTFEVPEDAENIEMEYETNYWTEDKIVFIGE